MNIVYTIIVMLIMLFIITFSLENTADVTLQYLNYHITMQTFMLLFVTFLAGIIFAGFMGIVERFRLSRTINKLNKTIRELRRDLRAKIPSIEIRRKPMHRIPERGYPHSGPFRRHPDCGKIYWSGAHRKMATPFFRQRTPLDLP
jgi:uncharacterized integral membrane protein